MGNEKDRLVLEVAANALFENVLRDGRVDGRERVVKKVNVSITVESSGQVNSGSLTAAQTDTSVTDNRLVAKGKELEVLLEGTNVKDGLVAVSFKGAAKEDVLADGSCKGPGLLTVRKKLLHFC